MGETCPKCRRESRTGSAQEVGERYYDYCWAVDGTACRVAAAGYRRGIDEGVLLAKEHARVAVHSATDDGRDVVIARTNWTDVDKAAADVLQPRRENDAGR